MDMEEDELDHKHSPTLQFVCEYGEIYSSLETIGRLVSTDVLTVEITELYNNCNAIIEKLLIDETFPAFLDSLQQLQKSLLLQRCLVTQLDCECINQAEESPSINSISSETTSATHDMTDANDSPASNINREQECEESGDARSRAIASTRKAPKYTGLGQVAGLDEAKQLLQEALVLPIRYPHLFQGHCQPWSRVLLYGPPGTGKTRLAHAVAAEIDADFYCISTADLLSSFVGESEKMIRELFSLPHRVQSAESRKPVIFIDEIDSLCRKRTTSEAEHARRLKTELLIQIEEAASKGIFLLCATNCPWDLDLAFLRRFQRRIYISTPNRDARRAILELHSGIMQSKVKNMSEEDNGDDLSITLDWTQMLDLTEGYSGSDLATLAQYALLQPIRELQDATYWAFKKDGLVAPCDPQHPSVMICSLNELPPTMVGTRDVNISDFLKALTCTPPTISQDDLKLYEDFTKQYGQYG